MNSKLKDILNKKAKTLERKRKVVLLWSKVYRIIIVPLKITFRACSFILAIICAAFPPALVYLLITGVIYFLLEIINNPLHLKLIITILRRTLYQPFIKN